MPRAFKLRTALIAFLTLTTVASFFLIDLAGLIWSAGKMARNDQAMLNREVSGLVIRTEMLLEAVEQPLKVIASSLRLAPADRQQALLDAVSANQEAFSVIYLVSEDGKVKAIATGHGPGRLREPTELLNTDLSANRLYRQTVERRQLTWSDKYLSALTGQVTIGIAVPMDGQILIGEVPLQTILETLRAAVGTLDVAVWLVDGGGEVLADSAGASGANFATMPIVRAALNREQLPAKFQHEGKSYQSSVAHSIDLDWTFVARAPTGIDSPLVREVFSISLLALGAALLVGMLLAPMWANWMARPLDVFMTKARDLAAGLPVADWPRGRIVELNNLSTDLEHMAVTLVERELKFQSLFEASPVGKALCDPSSDMAIIDINPRMAELLGIDRTDAVGKTDLALGIWPEESTRNEWWSSASVGPAVLETQLRRQDGRFFEARMLARTMLLDGVARVVWVCEDVSEARQLARDLAALNLELEVRVGVRTMDLAEANQTLNATVKQLKETQQDLVRSEKLAALGGLVARVAHELNTPIGNALMAVTTMQEQAQEVASLPDDVKAARAVAMVRNVQRGTDISHRNLAKAAELVTSFKQVAVDQTSSQRRKFLLDQVVQEMAITMSPMFRRTPVELHVNVPAALELDSYPGALGTVLNNLIRNALLHAFDGRGKGNIWIDAEPIDGSKVEIRVRDDGVGIPAALQSTVFEPFVTTKMGRGGTGLGLHITHNAVQNVLAGSISLVSNSEGTCFAITLPLCAPIRVSGTPAVVDE